MSSHVNFDAQVKNDDDTVGWPKEVSNTLTMRSRSTLGRNSENKMQKSLVRRSLSQAQVKSNKSTTPMTGGSFVRNPEESNENGGSGVRQLGKYTYSAKFVRKRLPDDSQASRLRLGNEMELKRYYDIHRNKYDEMILLSRATNAIIAVFTTAYASLKASNDCFTSPVTTCLDTPVTKPDAWTGLIAEALKFISNESVMIQSSEYLNKKRVLNQAKQVLTSTVREALEVIDNMEKLAEKLNAVLQDCARSITSMMTGCRSRFYQSVWQTDILMYQQGQGDAESSFIEENLLNSVSSSMSTSSLLSLHLLTPYVRWDVDGISIKKQVSKSWPLLKFSYLSFPHKLDFLTELFAGFFTFLEAPTQNIENSLDALQETSTEPRRDVTLLDHQFRTILNVLLSERYFHPAEQHKALVFGFKIQKNFQRLQDELEKVQKSCRQLNENWKRIFKNNDLTLSNAASVVAFTNVPLWKSCKDFCFQLDLNTENNDSKSLSVLKSKRVLNPPIPDLKQPKILVKNFPQALQEHFEVLEDFEESYQQRLQELKGREELLIVENDIKPCTDLAQQLFFHFEHIGSSLNDYTRQLIASYEVLFNAIPTDPPTAPATYSNFSPLRWPKEIQANLLQNCTKSHQKAEKFMERILSYVEKYFNLLDDNLKILSRISSAENLPVDTVEKEYFEDTEISINQDDEVSVFVTVNGVYFNQFGAMFSLRLDATTVEHRFRIVELFLNHVSLQVEQAIILVKRILAKFGRKSISNPWWKHFLKSSQPSMLIEGGLQDEVYNKTIFHLLNNVKAAFSKANVKASLEIYSELEATILIRSTRILEDEIVKYGRACQVFSQGLANLESFRKYFKKSCLNVFQNNSKFSPPFEHWNNKICCFKLLIKDDSFKNQLDQVLNSTASENASRASSDHQISVNNSPSNAGGGIPAVIAAVNEIYEQWVSTENQLWEELQEENALMPEGDATISRAISLSTGFTDRKYISETEATSIIIANGVTQLHLETFPRRYKLILLKKLKSLSSKLNECSAIISHSESICYSKVEKANGRVKEILNKYSHFEIQEGETGQKEGGPLVDTAPDQITTEGSVLQKDSQVCNSADASDMDVFVSLDFPFESVKLSYRGYERSVSFRGWNKQPADQAKVLDSMLESVSDQLSKKVEISRKLSVAYVQLSRAVKKMSQKVDQSLPLPQSTLTELLSVLRKVLENMKVQKALTALQDISSVLQIVNDHLKLAVEFLKKHEELSNEPNFSQNDVTLTVRNPFEKDIRQLFSKPIRVVLPYSQFELKL
ncbi:unnamed protein product [Allacma fusca]|uniref:Uncharacterized protein n=1 Tax=Allacma fusca TaxID=39272 RepID=A0A8J2PI73_9HEXA|nr:unnamed protein product [Allacma fusca]